ncbi:MAG: ribulose phosphate epimerase [Nannocystis sp.]|nr:ribulose phosphate epimerase [Nannocystis sp.]
MKLQPSLSLPLSLLLGALTFSSACGDDKGQDETSNTGTTTGTPATDSDTSTSGATDATTSTSTGTGTGTGTGTDTDTDPTCSFLDCETTTAGGGGECDIWAQDCPEGEKCMPWANDGGSAWNATKCSPLDMNAKPLGDECMGGGVSGVDNCDKGSMCYYVDGETGLGVCIPFCIGTPDSPSCADPNNQCSISNNGVLILCRQKCDPLLQDCEGAAACLPAAGSDFFVCIVDASGENGKAGDPCEFLNACDPGHFCATASFVPDCVATGCCTEFCDLSDPDKDSQCSMQDKGVTCTNYYEPGTEPPGLENVGACLLPQP